MSCDASDWTDNKENGKNIFMIKKKNENWEKTKSKDERIESDVP